VKSGESVKTKRQNRSDSGAFYLFTASQSNIRKHNVGRSILHSAIGASTES
jgi:hypothetical protein